MIDDQHKELFSRYSRLLATYKEGKGREETGPLLDFMVEYVSTHFAGEERFMEQYDYPGSEINHQQHRELVQHVNEVSEEFRDSEATVAVITAINQTMFNWLLRHVKKADVNLGRFLDSQVS